MEQFINISDTTLDDKVMKTVNARELHQFLGIRHQYSNWIKVKLQRLGAEENVDYVVVAQPLESRGRPLTEYFISLDIAKELCLMANNPQGDKARRHFLELERRKAQALEALSHVNLDLSSGVISYRDGDFYVSSLSIANETGKRHHNLLKEIENEIKLLSEDRSDELQEVLEGFKRVVYIDKQGKPRKAYELNKLATCQILKGKHRAYFLVQFKRLEDVIMNLFKLKVVDQVLPESKGKRQYIYIIKNTITGNIKIGVGIDPEARVNQLQTGCDAELALVYTSFVCSNAFKIESEVHKEFEDYHVRGEWFNVPEDQVIDFLTKRRFVLKSQLNLGFDSKLLELIERK